MFLCHGFVMVRDILLSWFRHGSSWFVMVHVMVRDVSVMVSSWFVMFYCHGFVMVRHGSRHGS